MTPLVQTVVLTDPNVRMNLEFTIRECRRPRGSIQQRGNRPLLKEHGPLDGGHEFPSLSNMEALYGVIIFTPFFWNQGKFPAF